MELKINIPDYSPDTGFRSEWEYGFEIKTTCIDKEIVIAANKAGLISLAKQLLTLAQDEYPSGYHYHLDNYNSLEDGSVKMIIGKI